MYIPPFDSSDRSNVSSSAGRTMFTWQQTELAGSHCPRLVTVLHSLHVRFVLPTHAALGSQQASLPLLCSHEPQASPLRATQSFGHTSSPAVHHIQLVSPSNGHTGFAIEGSRSSALGVPSSMPLRGHGHRLPPWQ